MNASLSEKIFDKVPRKIPAGMRETCEKLLVDVAGLCVAARNTDYAKSALAGWEASGACTAIGHARALDAAGAAFVNGTAAHGEDFDDTFEGGPVHAGAVVVPAMRWRSAAASSAGTTTAPACTGPPSKVSSKSSP